MTGEESNPMKSAYSYYSEAEDIKARMRVAYKEFLSWHLYTIILIVKPAARAVGNVIMRSSMSSIEAYY